MKTGLATLVVAVALSGTWSHAKPDAGEGRGSSPDVIAFSRPLESSDIFMVNEDGSGERKLVTLRNRPSNLSFSPSGKKLAAITSGGNVKTELVVINVASGKVTELSGSSQSPSRTALIKAGLGVCEGRTCWATENVIYFTAAIKGQGVLKPVVAKMDISVPKVEIVVKNAKNPALSADGKKLAYIHLPANRIEHLAGAWKLSDPGDLIVMDLAGGATKTIYAHSRNTPADRQNSRGYIFEAVFHPDGKHLNRAFSWFFAKSSVLTVMVLVCWMVLPVFEATAAQGVFSRDGKTVTLIHGNKLIGHIAEPHW